MKHIVKHIMQRMLVCCICLLCTLALAAQPALNRVEYYIDTDPGYGSATSISFTTGAVNLANLALNIDPGPLSTGVHVLGIRARDANNAWSLDNKWLFVKPYSSNSTVPNISRVEYYIDTDPGYGSATNVSIGTGTNFSNLTVNIDPASLSTGVHLFGIRSKDANGAWSLDNKWLFVKPYSNNSSLPNISRVEYYIDTDPGYDNATNINIGTGTNFADLTVNIDPAALATGVHVLGIRSKDANGAWSLDNKWLFVKPNSSNTSVPNLSRIEYYIDTDPGYGNGVPVAINNITNLNNYSLPVNISGLAAGAHKLFMRSKDANNAWSLDNIFEFTVTSAVANPSIVVNSVTKKSLCEKDNFSVSYQANGTYNAGNIFNVQLSDASGSFASPTAIGSFTGTGNSIIACSLPASVTAGSSYRVRVASTNPVVTGITGADVLTINALPAKPTINPPGPISFCTGSSVTLTSSSATNNTWSTGATTQSINVTASGNYTVTVSNASGCSNSSNATAVTVNPKPSPVIVPSGSVTDLCPGASVTLNADMVYAGYLWSTGATTSSINVSAAGAYTLTATNNFGCSGTSSAVNVTYQSCAKPKSPKAKVSSSTKASLKWKAANCAVQYQLQYRVVGSGTWTTVTVNDISYKLNNLVPSTTYEWQVATVCQASPQILSGYAAGNNFTTDAALGFAARTAIDAGDEIKLYPNPSKYNATLQLGSMHDADITIADAAGKTIWQRHHASDAVVILPVEKFTAGVYLVTISNGKEIKTLKLVKE